MRSWINLVLIFLFLINALLVYTYFDNRSKIVKSFQIIRSVKLQPEDFLPWGRSSRSWLRQLQLGGVEVFAKKAGDLDGIIYRLRKASPSSPVEYFSAKTGLSPGLQDSLWDVYRGYQLNLEEILVNSILPRRHRYLAFYKRAVALSFEAKSASPSKRGVLQDSLDVLINTGYTKRIQIDDLPAIEQRLSRVRNVSMPTDEIKVKGLISKLSDLMPLKGTILMRGKIHRLDEVTPAEIEGFSNELSLLKLEIDEWVCLFADI